MYKRLFVIIAFLLASMSMASGIKTGTIPWGTQSNQLGLRSGYEIECVGPLSFALDTLQQVYFLDSIQEQIKQFTPQGTYLKSIGTQVRGSSIAVDADNNIGILDNGYLHLYTPDGLHHQVTYPLLAESVEGYGLHLRTYKNQFMQTDLKQNLWTVAGKINGKYQGVSTAAAKPQYTGVPATSSNLQYSVSWQNDTTVYLLDSNGTKYSIYTPDIWGGVQVVGINQKGEIILEMERLTHENILHLELYRLSPSGIVLSIQEIPNHYYTTVYKKTELAQDGSVYQMLTTPAGVEIWQWQL